MLQLLAEPPGALSDQWQLFWRLAGGKRATLSPFALTEMPLARSVSTVEVSPANAAERRRFSGVISFFGASITWHTSVESATTRSNSSPGDHGFPRAGATPQRRVQRSRRPGFGCLRKMVDLRVAYLHDCKTPVPISTRLRQHLITVHREKLSLALPATDTSHCHDFFGAKHLHTKIAIVEPPR